MYNGCLISFLVVLFLLILLVILFCCMYNPHIPLWYETTKTPWYGVAESLPMVKVPGKDRIVVFMVATPEIHHYSRYSIEVNREWAKQHGYDFVVYDKTAIPSLPINFSKIQYSMDLIDTKKYDYVMYIDADAIVIRKDYDVRHLIKKFMTGTSSIVFGEDCFGPKDCSKPGKINSGVFIVKSSMVGRAVLESWKSSAMGSCSRYVNVFPSCQLVFSHCVFPKWFWAIRIIPFNLMNGYKGSLLIKHAMAIDDINRVDVLKRIYQKNSDDSERIPVF